MIPAITVTDSTGGTRIIRPSGGAVMVWERLTGKTLRDLLATGISETALLVFTYVMETGKRPESLDEVEEWAVGNDVTAVPGEPPDPTPPAP